MMNRIDNSGEGIARLGRDEDNYLAHVAQGEMVVPPVITPETRQRLEQDMMNMGLDPDEYTVGGGMSINPITGNPEFGFLKKIAKGLKKVVKKIAPIASIIPGPWQPFAAVYQKGSAALNIAKGEGGLGDLMTVFAGGNQKIFGKDGALKSITSGGFKDLGGGFGKAFSGIGSIDGKFKPFQYGTNMAKQYKDDQKQGYFGLFSGGDQPVDYMSGGQDGQFIDANYQPSSSDMPSPEEMKYISENYTVKGESGMLADKDGNLFSPADVLKQVRGSQTQSSGLGDFLGGIFRGGGSDGVGNYGVIGDLLGGFTDKLGITNYGGDEKSGGGLGNLGIAGLAGLVGKLAYEDAKNNKGVPLTPLTTMDQLGRYNIAAEMARQKGEEAPSRVEYGLNPQGMPVLQGGGTGITPRGAAQGGIMSFANGSPSFDINVRNPENEKFAFQVLRSMQKNPNLPNELTQEQKQKFEHGLIMSGEQGMFMQIVKKMKDDGNNYNPSSHMSNIYTAADRATRNQQREAAQMNMGGIMAFAQGGAVAMAEGGDVPIDPANFPVMDGQIDGPGTETSDDIPAMLSDGEFVMTAKAVKGAGAFDVNDSNGILTLTPNGDASRDSGTRVMYKLMEHFGGVA